MFLRIMKQRTFWLVLISWRISCPKKLKKYWAICVQIISGIFFAFMLILTYKDILFSLIITGGRELISRL